MTRNDTIEALRWMASEHTLDGNLDNARICADLAQRAETDTRYAELVLMAPALN